MINSTIPTLALPNDRFFIPFDVNATFVRSSCLKKIQQSGRGSLISQRPKKSSGISHEWKIGILHSIWYNQRNKLNHIELWEFLDVVDQDGIPSLLKCDRWESMLPLLQIQMYYLYEIDLLFLNQVRNKITMCIFFSNNNFRSDDEFPQTVQSVQSQGILLMVAYNHHVQVWMYGRFLNKFILVIGRNLSRTFR